jgi:3-dehydroquinate dehydratase type I
MGAFPAIGGVALDARRPRVVAAGGVAELDALLAADGADIVELRADMWDAPDPAALPGLLARLRRGGRPIILTARAAAEGGRALDEGTRQALYVSGLEHADAVDVEIASTEIIGALLPRARATQRTVILSAHVLAATPPATTLLALADRARALGADVTKIVTYAADVDDVRTLIEVTLAARAHGIVTLATGPLGNARVFLPMAGSLLTYAHVGRPTAPSGQLPLPELVALLRRFYPDAAP